MSIFDYLGQFQQPTTLHSFRERDAINGGHQTQQGNLNCVAATSLCRTGRNGLVAVCLTLDTDEFFTEVRGRTITGIAIAQDFSSATELYR